MMNYSQTEPTGVSASWLSLVCTPQGMLRPAAVCLSALLISCLYLPTVLCHFDFADDGASAHPTGIASFADFHHKVWDRTYSEFLVKGPYRPMAWYCWIGQQEALAGNPLLWRCVRFLCTALAAGLFLCLLQELGFGAGVSIVTTLVAMWNPYRAEVWISLTFCEGIAMPFAIGGLVCAYRAPRSGRAWAWDLGAMAGAFAAVACKNVFAVVIPAQMFLRVCHPDLSLREGIKQFGWRAVLLGSILFFPVAHFVCYRLTMNEQRYEMIWDPRQPIRLLSSFLGGMGKDFLAPAFASALALLAWSTIRKSAPTPTASESMRFRAAFGTGVIIFLLGWGIYAPMDGVAGRYMLPGIWGLDILSALLWAKVWSLTTGWKRITYALLACGLVISAAANLGKQNKNLARITTLWDALTCVETEAPLGSRIGWVAIPDRRKTEELEIGEGVHFRWHLFGRGRSDLYWQNYAPGESGRGVDPEPTILITSSTTAPRDDRGSWQLLKECRHSYWFGRKEVVCCVWKRSDTKAVPAPGVSSESGS